MGTWMLEFNVYLWFFAPDLSPRKAFSFPVSVFKISGPPQRLKPNDQIQSIKA